MDDRDQAVGIGLQSHFGAASRPGAAVQEGARNCTPLITVRTTFISSILALAISFGCGKGDNSADTDQAGQDLRNAQSAVNDQGKTLVADETELERKKGELLEEQQALAESERSIDASRQQLGTARNTLEDARGAYRAAVTARFAKLDAALAVLTTKTEAAAKDAAAGLRARRDLLAAKLATIPAIADPGWRTYTNDVDTTFDAIERDLGAATP